MLIQLIWCISSNVRFFKKMNANFFIFRIRKGCFFKWQSKSECECLSNNKLEYLHTLTSLLSGPDLSVAIKIYVGKIKPHMIMWLKFSAKKVTHYCRCTRTFTKSFRPRICDFDIYVIIVIRIKKFKTSACSKNNSFSK